MQLNKYFTKFKNIFKKKIGFKKREKRKVILLTQFYPPDLAATGQLLAQLAEYLDKNNITVEIFCAEPAYATSQKNEIDFEKKDKLKITRSRSINLFPKTKLSRLVGGFFYCIKGLYFLFKSYKKGDLIIYSTEPPFLIYFARIFHFLNKSKYILIIYDLYPDILFNSGVISENNILTHLFKFFNNNSYDKSSAIVVLSENMAKKAGKYLPNNFKNKINVIPSWSDENFIKPIDKKNNFFAREFNLEDFFTVMYSGNQGRCHDFKTIVEAMILLKENHLVKFIFIGDGFQHNYLVSKMNEYKLKNCLILPYQKYSVIPYSLTSADLAIVSIKKGFEDLIAPSKFYGHLAAGTAIALISPPKTYLRKLIEKNNIGKWFNNGMHYKLSEWIDYLSRNPGILKTLGKNSRNILVENYSRSRICEQYLELIKKNLDY